MCILIKTNEQGSIALCRWNTVSIINGYHVKAYNNKSYLPMDLSNMIESFIGCQPKIMISHIQSGTSKQRKRCSGWMESEYFDDRDIVQIACNRDKFYYLDSNGTIYYNTKIGSRIIPLLDGYKYTKIVAYQDQLLKIDTNGYIQCSKDCKCKNKVVKFENINDGGLGRDKNGKHYIYSSWYHRQYDFEYDKRDKLVKLLNKNMVEDVVVKMHIGRDTESYSIGVKADSYSIGDVFVIFKKRVKFDIRLSSIRCESSVSLK